MATQKRACPTEEGLSRRHLHATCRVHVRWHLALPENWQRFSRACDADPNATFKFQDPVTLSRTATGTKHPGPLSMAQPSGTAPAVSKDDQDHWIFSAAMKLASGEDLPFSLVLRGVAQQ